ncbi:hypothetical protein EV426DRAFT_578501 [Tirmania nivea]|nr:hypothetical protein EV426DRAFT_578501 [Tirmania nivea]
MPGHGAKWSQIESFACLGAPCGFHMIFSLYGPVARTIFHLILPPLQNDEEDQIRFKEDFARYEELIEKKAVQTVLANDYLFIEDTPSAISHTGSHTLTLILPTSPIKSAEPKQIQRSYQLTPITNHVLSRIAQAAIRRDAEKGKAFFNQVINRYPQVFGSLQGVVFETLVHRLLSLGPTLWLYDLPLTHGRTPPPVEILISIELSESREFANLENLGSQLRLRKNSPNIHPKSLNTYLRPTIRPGHETRRLETFRQWRRKFFSGCKHIFLLVATSVDQYCEIQLVVTSVAAYKLAGTTPSYLNVIRY